MTFTPLRLLSIQQLLLLAAIATTTTQQTAGDVKEGNIVFVAPEREVRGVPVSAREPKLVGIDPESLDPNSIYEITFSYPATSPALYTVRFVSSDEGHGNNGRATTATTRTLQNVHQFFFTVNDDKPPLVTLSSGRKVFLVAVSVVPEGKTPLDREAPEDFIVLTNIFLSRHVAGVPLRALPVLLSAFALGLLVVLLVVYTEVYRKLLESCDRTREDAHEL